MNVTLVNGKANRCGEVISLLCLFCYFFRVDRAKAFLPDRAETRENLHKATKLAKTRRYHRSHPEYYGKKKDESSAKESKVEP